MINFDWDEYFNLAQELAGAYAAPAAIPGLPAPVANLEARCRSAISLAYYAAFIRARNHLRDVDQDAHVPTDGLAHQYVPAQMGRSADPRRKRIGGYLKQLRRQRNRADYDDQMPGLFADTTIQLTIAQKALAELDQL